eukprot:TRINITY_DN10790_c0_g1_i1.p1 TRINITY_DN10790_c0_g1~~TRINITY_DN10790_c0_g1_i1.p1  ORF type:complete len:209 (-),score=11.29 TRINITY_DN10790_c0_g1_i1:37-597(-)
MNPTTQATTTTAPAQNPPANTTPATNQVNLNTANPAQAPTANNNNHNTNPRPDVPQNHFTPFSTPCKFYMNGFCKNGKSCRYRHVRICDFFLNGSCKFGNQCRNHHQKACMFFSKGRCNSGNSCQFFHDQRHNMRAHIPPAPTRVVQPRPNFAKPFPPKKLQPADDKQVNTPNANSTSLKEVDKPE